MQAGGCVGGVGALQAGGETAKNDGGVVQGPENRASLGQGPEDRASLCQGPEDRASLCWVPGFQGLVNNGLGTRLAPMHALRPNTPCTHPSPSSSQFHPLHNPWSEPPLPAYCPLSEPLKPQPRPPASHPPTHLLHHPLHGLRDLRPRAGRVLLCHHDEQQQVRVPARLRPPRAGAGVHKTSMYPTHRPFTLTVCLQCLQCSRSHVLFISL